MKAVIIYSGKGGVGKTTTTANIARTMARNGKKTFILDADINTPSMNVEFQGEHPEPNMWVHSTGNIFDKFIYLEKAMVQKFIRQAQDKIREIKPEYILIDTPPSMTNVHIEIMKLVKISALIFVSQPTALSREDVLRTAQFFKEKCSPCTPFMIENMCFQDTLKEPPFNYGIKVITRIPMQDNFDTRNLSETAKEEYEKVVQEIDRCGEVEQPTFTPGSRYDETFDIKRIYRNDSFRRSRGYTADILRDGEENEKEMSLPKLRFLSVRTWDKMIREIDSFENWPRTDRRVLNCTTERIKRLVDAFAESETAYFMVTNAPLCEIRLITGEVGIASLKTDGESHYGIPRIEYQTGKGTITLFPDEVMPVGMQEIQQFLSEGYSVLSDSRYLPPKDTVRECEEWYGARVGILEDWEEKYDEWTKI